MLLTHAAVDEVHAEVADPASDVAAPAGQVFDLPAMPLDEALNRYAAITGQPALFPSDLLVGRRSGAVSGRFSAEAALQKLLEGTGLSAVRRGAGGAATFVLKEVGPPASNMANTPAPLFMGDAYAGTAQAGIWNSLCGDPLTRPGNYTALLRFRIGADGRVKDARLLDGTGDAARDAALVRRLDGVRVPGTVPARLHREVLTMVVLPNDPGGPQCSVGQGEH